MKIIYRSITKTGGNELFFLLSIVFAVSVYLYFYRLTKDSLNPFGISILSYMVCYAFSTLRLSLYQTELLFISHILSLLPIVIILLLGIVYCNNHKRVFKVDSIPVVTSNYVWFMWVIAIISMICVIYLNITRGTVLDIHYGIAGTLNKRKAEIVGRVYSGTGIIGKFAQIYPYTIVFIAYDFIFREKKTLITKIVEVGYCSICTLYALFVLASRGTLLLSSIGILYLLNKKYHFSAKKLAVILLVMIIAFSLYMNVRVISGSVIYSGTKVSNKMFNSIYNYFALSFNNFDKLVRQGSPYTIIQCTLKSVSKLLGIYNEKNLVYHKTFIYNEELFIYNFYHDLGVVGVIIWTTIIYFLIGKIYIYSKEKMPEMVLLLAMYGKAIIVIPFGNYFLDSLSMEIIYYVCLALLIMGYKFRKIALFKVKALRLRCNRIHIRGKYGQKI